MEKASVQPDNNSQYLDKQQLKQLIQSAMQLRQRAYAPYSGKSVGAAVLTANGHIYPGCNIENAAHAPGLCAERVALAGAVAAGEQQFIAIAICGGTAGEPAQADNLFYPCGMCRQMMAEFFTADTLVICAADERHYQLLSFAELLPYPYPPQRRG